MRVRIYPIYRHCVSLFPFFFSFTHPPHFFLIQAISSDHWQTFFPLLDSLANVPFCHRRGHWGGPVMATHSHFTCQAKAGPIIVPGPSSPSSSVLPPACLTGTLFFSDSSSIGWASSLIGVAVCGWLGSVKESPERGTGRWMDSGSSLQVPKADCCASLQLERGRWTLTLNHRYTSFHANTHSPGFTYTLAGTNAFRHEYFHDQKH